MQRLKKDVRGTGGPPIGSPGWEWTPSPAKLLLREKPGCGWIQTRPQTTMICV